jgi:hypothetical protein
MKNKFYFAFIFALVTNLSLGQARYNFQNESLTNGNDKEVGATYRFNNVKAGTDALVKVTAITGGVELKDIDGPQGLEEALQPVVKTKQGDNGYVEMEITFVAAGTNTPQVQTEVPVSSIDIDGNQGNSGAGSWLKEFDQIKLEANSYYNYMNAGGHLQMSTVNGWMCGKNTMMTEHTDIDTIGREVMFSVVHANVSKIMMRSGVENNDNNNYNRQRSFYFKAFVYPNAFLPIDKYLSLTGVVNNSSAKLNWTLANTNSVTHMILEKSTDARNWQGVYTAQRNEGVTVAAGHAFTYNDNQLAAKTYYRLKQVTTTGEIAYSNIVVMQTGETSGSIKVYPTVFTTATTVQVQSSNATNAVVTLTDMSGRTVYQNKMAVANGANALQLNDLGKVQNAGQYILSVAVNGAQQSFKVVKH